MSYKITTHINDFGCGCCNYNIAEYNNTKLFKTMDGARRSIKEFIFDTVYELNSKDMSLEYSASVGPCDFKEYEYEVMFQGDNEWWVEVFYGIEEVD